MRVRSQAGLGRLSISNQLLIALARPDATFVAGFKALVRDGATRPARAIVAACVRPQRYLLVAALSSKV